MMRDLVVLGGGAAGTSAALEARDRGLDVVLVEARVRSPREQSLAALADELAHRPLRRAPLERRVEGFRHAVRRAGEAAAALVDHRDQRLARSGVARLIGHATLPGEDGLVVVESLGMREELRARHVLIASGSRPRPLLDRDGPTDGDDRADLLDLEAPPASACVAGGGRMGVLLAGLLACAGTEVTLVEASSRLLPGADADVASAVQRALEHAGARLVTGLRAQQVSRGAGAWDVPGVGSVERLYVTAGRLPDLSGFGPFAAGVTPTPASEHATTIPWLFLAGAATGRAMTAEAARRDGRAAVRGLLGRTEHVPIRDVPAVVGGAGACGWAGMTEDEARASGQSTLTGRARLPGRGSLLPGFVKVVGAQGSRRVLGVHVAGQGREAVTLGAAMVELGASLDDLAAMAFPPGPAQSLVDAAASASA